MAPEVSNDMNSADEERGIYTNAVDIWSFACMAYEMMALRLPFLTTGDRQTFCRRGGFPENPLRFRTSEQGIAFIKRALVPNPTVRLTAIELLEDDWIHIDTTTPDRSYDRSYSQIPAKQSNSDHSPVNEYPRNDYPLEASQSYHQSNYAQHTQVPIRRPLPIQIAPALPPRSRSLHPSSSYTQMSTMRPLPTRDPKIISNYPYYNANGHNQVDINEDEVEEDEDNRSWGGHTLNNTSSGSRSTGGSRRNESPFRTEPRFKSKKKNSSTSIQLRGGERSSDRPEVEKFRIPKRPKHIHLDRPLELKSMYDRPLEIL